jgi:cell division protease FtsH
LKRFSKNLTIYILLFAIVFGVAYFFNGQQNTEIKTTEIELSKFISYLDREMISEVEVNGVMVTGKTGENEYVYCYVPSAYEVAMLDEQYFFPMAKEGKIVYKSPKPSTGSFWLNVIPNVLMIGAMIFLFYIMMNGGGNGKAFQFAKSRARQVKGEKTTFDDVAGLEEEKAELEEIVDFLKNPGKYNELGARIPKGVLLVGPPGTGKTYISRAAAGEAGVPFFTISGSDFVEMFVGVGASRVRDLFGEAKKNAPCIVFIDEIDAVGRKRGSGIGGGHDEREQTLNQLLVEMDGFAPNAGIIVMAATNRPDVLDPALLRPGRFDRQIVIGLPDVKGREAIIKVHSRNKPLADDVTPEILARRTMGFTPADLENVLNEAALITARRNGRFIRMEEIEEAIRKVQMGPAKKSRVVSDEEKKLTAYHEAGHAVVSRSLPKHMDVHEVTIIPRGRAGGYTMYLPEDDNMFQTRQEMYNHIVTSMGGRVAEKLKMDDISVGASGDIQQATNIAREMVTKYGFSDQLGNVNYGGDGEVFLGADLTAHKTYSEETASMIDEEIRRIIGEAFALAEKILTENNDRLERVAQALLLVETIDGEQFEALYTGAMEPEDLKKSVDEEKELQKKQDEVEAKETERILREKAEIEAREAAQREKGYITLGEAYDGEDPDTKEGE